MASGHRSIYLGAGQRSRLAGKNIVSVHEGRGGSDYYHLATAADDDAVKLLQAREFFLRYTEETKRAAGGEVEVLPLEIVAETA